MRDDSAREAMFPQSVLFNCWSHKFSPDLLFSKIAQNYNWSDVFNTVELSGVISQFVDVIIDDGDIVCDWRKPMNKYSKLPEIRSLHDFVFTKNSVTNTVCDS